MSGTHIGSVVVIALLIAGIAMLVRSRPAPEGGAPAPATTAASPADPLQRLATLRFTPEQSNALLLAGLEIQKGVLPSQALDANRLAAFPEIERTLTAALCPQTASTESCARDRIDVPHCLDRAAEIVAWRRRARDQVDWALVTAAMGVSVTGREFPTYANLVRFCRQMRALDPATKAALATPH